MSDADRLIGRWGLLDFKVRFEDGTVADRIGARPFGSLIYTPAWMSAHLVAEGGEKSFFSYCGPWRLEGGLLRHEVRSSDLPGWIGRVLTRGIEWQGETLVLTARGVRWDDRTGEGRLRWERLE